ncbi:MAG: hydroxymethylglutaryl-CoA reductase [Cenarchaeum symbiont of Oopsacas minuta]|nr:hydroxymethylglutaryl-CoA reductase [Cenarchaeum symbiont of Oopsacas minuta]
MIAKNSAISGMHKKTHSERLEIVRKFADLNKAEVEVLHSTGGIGFTEADLMVENAIGTFALPLGIATNFIINHRDCLIPMVIEEPSVIAAASRGAKIARASGGFKAKCGPSHVIGQIQLVGIKNLELASRNVKRSTLKILRMANKQSHTLSKMNRGALKISTRQIDPPSGPMLIVEILVDAADAMGANVTNSMCEAIAPLLEKLTEGRALLRILSNYSTTRIARASAIFRKDLIGGSRIVDDMVRAFEFAQYDVNRAVTHNKGVMNAVTAISNATGQDGRALEAAAGAYAARNGRYEPFTIWSKDVKGNLNGTIEMPMQVGTIGGIAAVHPIARVCIKIARAKSARQLGCAIVSAGLAQNFSALHALVTDGIQHGHMRLHARNIAITAGVPFDKVIMVASKMVDAGNISVTNAKCIMRDISSTRNVKE